MSAYYIGVHVKTTDRVAVNREITALFVAEGFQLAGDEAASIVVEDEDRLPAGEDWSGVIVSGVGGAGWVSVYVADWRDSGALARGLSEQLQGAVLEVWVAEDIHWGYTYYESGQVRDRFADAPENVTEAPDEAVAYAGSAQSLAAILEASAAEFTTFLRRAQAEAGQFAGGPVDTLAQAVGLPFDHAFTGYDYFFEDDPDDYAEDLVDWPEFRHLAFLPPPGRESLVE